MNYDPNLIHCGRMAVQTVRLTFGLWKFRKTIDVNVSGNCRGLTVIEAAVENAYDQLPNAFCASDFKTITMTDENGEEMGCDEDDDNWLQNMLIAAEIIDIQPEKEGAAL